MSFRASAKLHRRLSEDVEVLRDVSNDCLRLLLLPSPDAGKRRLMQQLTINGHARYCVVRIARMLHQTQPNLQMIQFVLRNALRARSDEAAYFLPMLRVLAAGVLTRTMLYPSSGIFSFDNVLLAVEMLLMLTAFLVGSTCTCVAFDAPGLVYRFTCLANGASAQSNRIRNLHFPSPGADDDYHMVNICLFCRLNVESPGS